MARRAKSTLAERLLEALPQEHQLTEADTEMIGELVRPAKYSWSTTDGVLTSILVGDQAVRTAGDLRRVLATLPPRADDDDSGNALYDLILQMIAPPLQELVRTRVRLSTLIEVLEERGVELGADYTRRWYANYERDQAALWSQLFVQTDEHDKIFRDRHADWIAQADETQQRRFGAAVNKELRTEWAAMIERMRNAAEPSPKG